MLSDVRHLVQTDPAKSGFAVAGRAVLFEDRRTFIGRLKGQGKQHPTGKVKHPKCLVPSLYHFGDIIASTMHRLAMSILLPFALANAAATLVVPTNPVAFFYQQGGTLPATQLVPIQSIGDVLNFTATVASEGNWLRLKTDSGRTPGSVAIEVDPNGLAIGVYTGFLTISAQGASNNPQLLQVRLQILAGTKLTVSTTQLDFVYRTGGPAAPPQEIRVDSSGYSLDYAATVNSSLNWLSATPTQGATPGAITVRINPEALAAGRYLATVVIAAASAMNSPLTVTVSLQVNPEQTLIVSTTPLVFTFESALSLPLARTLLVGSNVSALGFTMAAASGASWLTIPTAGGTAPAVMQVRANPAGFAAGTYTSSVFVTSFGAVNSPVVVPVTMTISAVAPVVAIGGVVNAASSSATAIAPGSLITIYGSRFGTALANTKVEVNGVAAPISFLSDGQINAQMPFETAPGDASVVVIAGGVKSKALITPVTPVAPGLFLVGATTRLLAQNADLSLNSVSDPARVGTYITAYLTGQGDLDIPLATGAAAPATPLSRPKAPVSVTIGGAAAEVYFAGMTPGLIGVCQLNVQIPDLAAGEVQFIVKIGGSLSNTALLFVDR